MKIIEFCPICKSHEYITMIEQAIHFYTDMHTGDRSGVNPGKNLNYPRYTTSVFKCHKCNKVSYVNHQHPPHY